jgi:hypothetical protein
VRDWISQVFTTWGRPVAWPESDSGSAALANSGSSAVTVRGSGFPEPSGEDPEMAARHESFSDELDYTATDPMGGAAPKLNL